MLCILPVYKDDVPKLLDLIQWIRQLGGAKDQDATIVADAGTPPDRLAQCASEAKKCFHSVQLVTTARAVKGWPEGPNELFLAAAKHAYEHKSHWLFLEPDAVPLSPGWLDKLDIFYRVNGCRYMGQIVPCNVAGLPPKHFTGVGIYPHDAIEQIEDAIRSKPKVAFDISTAEILAPIAFHSDLFQHLWGEIGNPPTFAEKAIPGTNTFDLRYLKPKAVLYHRTKDGNLIRLLRKKFGVFNPEQNTRTFIQLGRFGDIILLLPAMKYIAETTGIIPRMIVSSEYVSVLDGVSYVEPVSLPVNWWAGMVEARRQAEIRFGGGRVLQCYARGWGIDLSKWPNYMASMIDRTGVPMHLFSKLPLVFDLRNREREAAVVPNTGGKPYICISTTGISSPFKQGGKILSILSHLRNKVEFVDIGKMRCHRIYDLLGIMDRALGTITIDTATLHLAHGCPRPYIALTVDGWCSSVPRGNCVLNVKYSNFMASIGSIARTVEKWL